jgi:predicted aspartyl protease
MEKLKLKLLNIDGDGFHLQASIKINGKAALVIVDTGASRTVFDKTEIRKYLKKEEIEEHDKLSTGLGTNSKFHIRKNQN